MALSGADAGASKDREGHGRMHVAALNDRVDVVRWLHDTHGMSVSTVDKQGFSVYALSKHAGSIRTARVVGEMVYGRMLRDFCWKRYHRRRFLCTARTRVCCCSGVSGATACASSMVRC